MHSHYQDVMFGDDFYVRVYGKGGKCDYGVPRSPVWCEVEPFDIGSTVEMFGKTFKMADLPKELRNCIWEAAVDAINDDKWENEE